MDKHTAIIIQARVGSSRLPQKVILPFYKKQTILDVLIQSLISFCSKEHIIVATTDNPSDEKIVNIAFKNEVRVFRGEEQNVLARFIGAAERYNIKTIIRVCSDNPFIQTEYVMLLIDKFRENPADYISFALNDGTPCIKTHYGFFAELVTLEALKKTASLTFDRLYTEHVTNYIYTHLHYFDVYFLPVPPAIEERKDLRLTVDTDTDFKICANIYRELKKNNRKMHVSEILSIIDKNSYLKKMMYNEIKRNPKK